MAADGDFLVLETDDVKAVVDVQKGGRLASLSIGEAELLWSDTNSREGDPLLWGMYPMVPFAGRIRDGAFTFDGTEYVLPQMLGEHAIHGYGFVNAWTTVDETTICWDFAEPWPFAGRATQRYALTPHSLTVEMQVDAIDAQPMQVGWHPWFTRQNTAGTLELDFAAASQYKRDDEGLPGRLIPMTNGPWDDCFTGLMGTPTLRWGELTVGLESSADHWVVYDEPIHALCVEPQTGPPNEINTAPRILDAGEQMKTSFTISWSSRPGA